MTVALPTRASSPQAVLFRPDYMASSTSTLAILSLFQSAAVGVTPVYVMLSAAAATYGASPVTLGGYLQASSPSTHATITSPVAAPANAWTHVAMTVPANNSSNVTLYINGTQVASTPLIGCCGASFNSTAAYAAILGANYSNLLLGGADTILTYGNGNGFPGSFADVQLYNSTLNATQVAAIANSNSSGGCHQFILAPPPPPSPPPAPPPPSPPPPAAVYLVSGPTCAGTGNATNVSATFAGASTSSGTVQPVDYNAAAALLTGRATGNFSQACAFTATTNQFTCSGLGLTMGETCKGASFPVSGSLTLMSQGANTLCSATSNQVNYSYTYTSGSYPCGPSTYCTYSHTTYATSSATQAVLVNPYDLATATQALSNQIGANTYLNLTLPGGAASWTAGAVGTAANGTCVVNGTDNVVCYGAQIPPGYGCQPGGLGISGYVGSCGQLAPGTVSPGGVCQFCPPGQVIANSSLTTCAAGTPAPLTLPAQCAGLVHRWGPAFSVVSGTSVSDVVVGGNLTLSSAAVYQPATGALQMQGMPVFIPPTNGVAYLSAANATYRGNASLLGIQPASGITLVRCPC